MNRFRTDKGTIGPTRKLTRLKRAMGEAFLDGYQNYTQYKVEMRTAACVTAVKKIVDAMRALGRI